MASNMMNPSDRGEESVKSAIMDQAEEGALVLVGMDSTDDGMSSAMRKKAVESGKRTQVHDISMNSSAIEEGHAPSIVESGNKLLLRPADPSSSNWMTRLVRVQDDLHHYRGNWKTAAEEMAFEAEDFAEYRSCWETAWRTTCGSFDYMTALSSMQFTYYTPGRARYNYAASTPPTLQIVSIKLAEIAGGLRWPLSVYGVVAIRDVVDRNRNFLFSCHSGQSQELTQDDPFLRLVGPSRAVVFEDRINIEMELKVKDPTGSQDKPLITQAWDYHEPFNNVSTLDFKNCFCTIELCMQVVRKTIQATILGVQVVGDGPWPFKYGARVTCSPVPGKPGTPNNPESGEIVMVNSKDEAKLYGSDGYLHLQRNVISVETEGRLDVHIQAYSKSGKMFAKKHVRFLPQFSKISQRHCFVRGAEVEITVAWSLVATNKDIFMVLGRNSCGS
uniref:Uncharacterized protein n=1 Tax=Avena sativa TaxID=4498 RepID=A0ACD5ZDZ7_AVESA